MKYYRPTPSLIKLFQNIFFEEKLQLFFLPRRLFLLNYGEREVADPLIYMMNFSTPVGFQEIGMRKVRLMTI